MQFPGLIYAARPYLSCTQFLARLLTATRFLATPFPL